MTSVSSKPRRRLQSLCALLSTTVSGSALAQVATSPSAEVPAELPAVQIIQNNKPTAEKPRAAAPKVDTAPVAAQQSSKPRARKAPAPSQSADSQSAPVADVGTADAAASVVSPTGTAVPVETTAASVTVITSGEISAQQRRTATDLLMTVPGIQVVQTNGPGGQTSIFTRGTNSNHTKVLIDGVDVSDPSAPNRAFDVGQLLTFNLDRVEVLRGPQSGLYGADALGGVIAVYTKSGEKGPPKIEGLVEAGSFGTLNEAVGARGGVDNVTYSINGAHMYVGHSQVTPLDILPPGTPHKDNSYENWSTSAKLGIDITRDVTVNLAGRYMTSDLKFVGDHYVWPTGFVPDAERSTQHTELMSGRAELVVRSFEGRVTSYIGANGVGSTRDYTAPVSSPTTYKGEREKYDWRSVVAIVPGTSLTLGADWQKESLDTADLAANESNTGGFAQLQTQPIRNLFLTGNVRLDDNEHFGRATTWRFSPAYVIEATGTKLKGNIGTAFKAPTLDQRFHDYPVYGFFANRDLKPEESTGYDAGFEQALFAGKAQFGAVYFHNAITNLIDYNGTYTTNINIGRASTSGVEAFFSADVTDDLRLRLDYTFTDAVDDDSGQQLLRRPKNKLTLSAGWRPMKQLLLTGSVGYIGEAADIDRVASTRVTLPGYTLVNVGAEYEVNDNVTLFGRINNLFDKQYQPLAGFEGQGLAAFGGVKLRN